jgi:hypothetical protein
MVRCRVLRLAGSCAFAAALIGCDGYIATKGRVYASAKADSSRIYVDEPFPNVDSLVRIDSALVWVFQRPGDQTFDTTSRPMWSQRTTSGHCGFFSTGQTAPPSRFEAVIEVRRSGFKDAVRRFRHDSIGTHNVLVVLSPLPGTAFSPATSSPPCS